MFSFGYQWSLHYGRSIYPRRKMIPVMKFKLMDSTQMQLLGRLVSALTVPPALTVVVQSSAPTCMLNCPKVPRCRKSNQGGFLPYKRYITWYSPHISSEGTLPTLLWMQITSLHHILPVARLSSTSYVVSVLFFCTHHLLGPYPISFFITPVPSVVRWFFGVELLSSLPSFKI